MILNGETAYEDEGIMITNDEFNTKTSIEIRNILLDKINEKSEIN